MIYNHFVGLRYRVVSGLMRLWWFDYTHSAGALLSDNHMRGKIYKRIIYVFRSLKSAHVSLSPSSPTYVKKKLKKLPASTVITHCPPRPKSIYPAIFPISTNTPITQTSYTLPLILCSSLTMPLEIQSLIAMFVIIGLTPLAEGKTLASAT